MGLVAGHHPVGGSPLWIMIEAESNKALNQNREQNTGGKPQRSATTVTEPLMGLVDLKTDITRGRFFFMRLGCVVSRSTWTTYEAHAARAA